jgi:short-subunit dehydrogenase
MRSSSFIKTTLKRKTQLNIYNSMKICNLFSNFKKRQAGRIIMMASIAHHIIFAKIEKLNNDTLLFSIFSYSYLYIELK